MMEVPSAGRHHSAGSGEVGGTNIGGNVLARLSLEYGSLPLAGASAGALDPRVCDQVGVTRATRLSYTTWAILNGFMRVGTHPRVLPHPPRPVGGDVANIALVDGDDGDFGIRCS